MNEPITQDQDHDRRLGRLEGIAEQLTEQGRQINARFDNIERSVDALRQEMRQELTALRQEQRRDFRWLIGIQLTTLLALGTLILSRLPG